MNKLKVRIALRTGNTVTDGQFRDQFYSLKTQFIILAEGPV